MIQYTFEIIHRRDIGRIRPLWENLRSYHLARSPYFRSFYEGFTFEERTRKFMDPGIRLRLEMAMNDEEPAAYCIASIDGAGEGEIDSIFVGEAHRGRRIGERLVGNACGWFDEEKVLVKKVVVMYGNEEALEFYRKAGFYPAHCTLKWKEQ